MASLNYDWRDPSLPIGALDSGLGGLSVLREIRKALPLEDLLFACDCGKAPGATALEAGLKTAL